jgi:hypothetical protein
MMCLWASYKKKIYLKKLFFASLKSMKKGVGYISKRYGSGDPDPHQSVMDPQHWNYQCIVYEYFINVCDRHQIIYYQIWEYEIC